MYAKLLKLDYFVDDFISYVKEVKKPTVSFLMTKPWNRENRGDLSTICSLGELYRMIRGT